MRLLLLGIFLSASPEYSTTVTATPPAKDADVPEERATSTIERLDIDRKLAPSTTDAISFEPGVFISQSSSGRNNAYIRGLTGQQTVVMFDGIRVNNSTYKQTSQYLFTIDPDTVDHIILLRGGSSTQFGSDAIGGVVYVDPINPPSEDRITPRLRLQTASADKRYGGRIEVGVTEGWFGFLGGVGGRRSGFLESAGSVKNPDPTTTIGPYPQVPRIAEDGRTQLGTGYKEFTADARTVLKLSSSARLTFAAYMFRQYDAPKTDRCPAPYAPYNSCLTYEEQFRHLAYAVYQDSFGDLMQDARFTASFQNQNERQRLDEPLVHSVYRSLDRVYTVGLSGRASTKSWQWIKANYGIDTYYDWVSSSASLSFTNVSLHRALSRGDYLQGSKYLYGGSFVDIDLMLGDFTWRSGGRLSWFAAWVPKDEQSSTAPVTRHWLPVVGHTGLEWRATPSLQVLANVDHSFRAPNLDDLEGRLQIGPGFQFENAKIGPERATTFEIGTRFHTRPLIVEAWIFDMRIQHAIVKVPRTPADCPENSPACRAAWSIFGLQNAPGLSEMRGAEALVHANFPWGLSARATVSYTWGEGPRLGVVPREPTVILTGKRIPLTRVPPLNGIVEIMWAHRVGLDLNADVKWATTQDRLSLADYKDADIPKYATPGFAIAAVGIAYRIPDAMKLLFRIENLFDKPYRQHGSSVNGAGRNAMLTFEMSL